MNNEVRSWVSMLHILIKTLEQTYRFHSNFTSKENFSLTNMYVYLFRSKV